MIITYLKTLLGIIGGIIIWYILSAVQMWAWLNIIEHKLLRKYKHLIKEKDEKEQS